MRQFQKAKEYADQEINKARHYFDLSNNKRLKELEGAINELRVRLSETQGKVRKNTEHHKALADDTRELREELLMKCEELHNQILSKAALQEERYQ